MYHDVHRKRWGMYVKCSAAVISRNTLNTIFLSLGGGGGGASLEKYFVKKRKYLFCILYSI